MKLVKINYSYYLYPQGIDNLHSFLEYLNNNMGKFIYLTTFKEDDFPYLLVEDMVDGAILPDNVGEIQELDATIMLTTDYNKLFVEYCMKYCADCINFKNPENIFKNIDSYKSNLSLSGECFRKERISEENFC